MKSLCTNRQRIVAGLMIALSLSGFSSLLAKGGGKNVRSAKLYIQQEQLEDAFRVLENEIEDVNPENEDAWYLLGYLYARQKKYDKMVEAFDKAVELNPKLREEGVDVNRDPGKRFQARHGTDLIKRVCWSSAFNSGVKYFNDAQTSTDDSMRAKSFDKSINEFEAAIELIPDSTLTYQNLAAAYINAGRTEESIPPLEQAYELNPNDKGIVVLLGQVYMATGRDSLAMPLLEKAWEEGVRTPELADNLSRAYMRAGQNEAAADVYESVVATNSDNFQFLYNYGTILLELQRYDAAIEQLEKAKQVDPESPDINYNLGAAYLNRGISRQQALPEESEDDSYKEDFRSALPYLEKAILMNPDDTKTWFTLGRIAGQLNKIALAGYAFSKGEPTRSALDKKVIVGMQKDALQTILGEPTKINPVESEQFVDIEEWQYARRPGANNVVAIPDPINIYVKGSRVDALMVVN